MSATQCDPMTFTQKVRIRIGIEREPKHIRINGWGKSKTEKTYVFRVSTKIDLGEPIENSVLLGYIKWHGPWRCYSFFVSSADGEFELVFEKQCLRDIANFCEAATIEQRALVHARSTNDKP